MARDRAYRRFRARKAKKRAELVYLLWDCGDGPHTETDEAFRKRWVGFMANCHCVPCSCFMCGNVRRFGNAPTLAEKRSERSMRDTLADEFGLRAADHAVGLE